MGEKVSTYQYPQPLLLSESDPYQNLSPAEIISKELRIKRHEYIPVSSLLLEESLTDPVHVENLARSMSGDRGQISPITVRPRLLDDGQIIYDIIDGFHRGKGLKLREEKEGHLLMADTVVVYGCSDEELYDLRVLAANSVSSVKFARMADWMHSAFRSARWKNERIPQLIASGNISIAQVFSLSFTNSSGAHLGLSPSETDEFKNWARNKSRSWNRPLGTLAMELRTVEVADPELVRQVRKGTGPKGGKGILTHARLKAITDKLPYEYLLQKQLVAIALEKNLIASELNKIADQIAVAKERRDFGQIDEILADPYNFLKPEDVEVKFKEETIFDNRENFDTEPELDSSRLQEIVRVQDALIKVHARRAKLTYRDPKAVEAIVKVLEYKLKLLDHGNQDYSPEIALDGDSGLVFDSLTGVISKTGRRMLVELSEQETEVLWLLLLFKGLPITKETVNVLLDNEVDLGKTVARIQQKLDKATGGMSKRLIGDPDSGYLWKSHKE